MSAQSPLHQIAEIVRTQFPGVTVAVMTFSRGAKTPAEVIDLLSLAACEPSPEASLPIRHPDPCRGPSEAAA